MTARVQVPWKGTSERVRTPWAPTPATPRAALLESGCLGMQPKAGGKSHQRLNTDGRPIANKYREGKMKRTLKRGSKVLEIVEREAIGSRGCPEGYVDWSPSPPNPLGAGQHGLTGRDKTGG